MSGPLEREVRLPHLRLAAQVWGHDKAPPLLVLHGWLDNAGSYARLAPLLAERCQVIALELPGHGHSDHLPPGMPYHFVDYVRAVLDAIDVLELQHFHLMGHSLGAGIASLVAAARPERVGRLLLIEGLGPIADDGLHTLRQFRDAMTSTATGRSLRSFPSVEMAISARTMASGLPADQARPIVERGLRKTDHGWYWRSDARVNRPSSIRLAEMQVRALLHGIESPTALLLARPDTPYLPGQRMRERADCVGDIVVTHMDGGHHLHLEHPQAVAAWANAHLDGHAA
ncbi:alpha/beta fold hydrolase [Dyella japonica]|uniref:Alpha/beta hydrolase n=1 Tax=Dyella japonica A8 TaxID=1217721 RepID=A0A075K0V1_9GAMM|nr:alpha/beta hydrolase [Dyella japonica]AIF45883.1 alpha/beta hydrolase [Dyella japonica A8]